MNKLDMHHIIAEAAVALQEAKERISELEAELQDAERRVQFLEKMLSSVRAHVKTFSLALKRNAGQDKRLRHRNRSLT